MPDYDGIRRNEDLGLGFPPADHTEDLVGVNENAPVGATNTAEAQVQPATKLENY
ncbi:hypothetical protein QSJ19_01470 [Gordonia sp. ABSL11-1]|uniref:hypothetical protein n=1 Tax=Gordonia sp. ABSL11-1 TaxID=3053924 RepID=UPI002573FA87|nr:hypothetical protein [Gordonia sp. ABSL11-1]MDL9944272.1 hypothetical protein [Gordonia sp. ABSL11-1]